MPAVYQPCRRKWRTRFSWLCVFILLNLVLTETAIKVLVHQPDTSKAPSLINGLQAVRQLHYRVITETGLTTADEMLYPSNLVLVDDLVSYHAVGARSVEDQEHRFVASGIDAPVGMKNPTSGNLGVMFNGIYAAQNKQTFLFHGQEVETSGNPLAHVILSWRSQ